MFLSSHILSEVEHACDRVGIVRSGRLVKVANLEELHRIRLHHVEIEFADGSAIPEEKIRTAAGVDGVALTGQILTCTVRGSFDSLLRALSGAAVENLLSHEPSLEEIFLEYYREEASPDALSIRP